MTAFGDYPGEMAHRPLDDDAIDALLADPAIDAVVGSFIEDLRFVASGPPPVPSPALAELLAGGLSADKGDLPVTAVSNAHGPALQVAGLPEQKRNKRMPIPQLIAGLSLAGKFALGAGVAAAATTGAAAAGALPDPVQNAVERTVAVVTPFEFPDEADGRSDFGADVSSDAIDEIPGVDGAVVSSAARGDSQRPAGAGEASEDRSGNANPAAAVAPATRPDPTTAAALPPVSVPPVEPPVSVPPVEPPEVGAGAVSIPPVSTPAAGRP